LIFEIIIKNVQHISELSYSIDLSKNKLHGIVGKNGVGKTTLIKAINNLQSTDTYQKTASPYIFNENSQITYKFGDDNYEFNFNEKLNIIDTKQIISSTAKSSIFVELPIPHGKRFSHFQKLGNIDEELRKSIAIESFVEPIELIEFLSNVYDSNRFDSLKEFSFKGEKYYFILKDNDYYIREDYFSSGEYFVVSLYKLIQGRKKCITIDEIDISLDAHAQVNLIHQLREFCEQYEVNIIFTTHSLPLMKTLQDDELFYMSKAEETISVEPKSYHYVKSLLFGFQGWDKYLLTEDEVLLEYIEHILFGSEEPIFYQYKVIHIGGANQVVSLMRRNESEHFLTEEGKVLCVLDGDQRAHRNNLLNDNVVCIPFESIEKDLYQLYLAGSAEIPRLPAEIDLAQGKSPSKALFKELIKNKLMSKVEIYHFLELQKPVETEEFKAALLEFLTAD